MKHLLCQLVDVKYGTALIPEETLKHLLKYCEENLGKDILKGNLNAVPRTEEEFVAAIERLALISVAVTCYR